MRKLKGTVISTGMAMAPPFLVKDAKALLNGTHARRTVEEELNSFSNACSAFRNELLQREKSVRERLGGEDAELIEGFREIVFDEEIHEGIRSNIVEGGMSAATAVISAGDENARDFEELEDPYLRTRAADIRDLFNEFALLCSQIIIPKKPDIPSVYICSSISTSDIIDADSKNAIAFVSEEAMQTSHAAILARAFGIPVIGGIPVEEFCRDDIGKVVLDGDSGEVIVNPDELNESVIREREKRYLEEKERLLALVDVPVYTPKGEEVRLYANIGSEEEVRIAKDMGADGVGLFRTEFLFIHGDQNSPPGEEEQFQAYKNVLQAMDGRPVKIRTIDVGGDKQVPSLGIAEEPNPFLGWRSIRYCLDNIPFFKIQLRALLRSAEYGSLAIMFPMICSLSEVRKLKAILNETREELIGEGYSIKKDIPLGIMVETPAAALIADTLAKEVDFFSIGSNDLVQYTLAVDRTNDKVAKLYDPEHPAISLLLSQTVEAARNNHIPVSICGELAGDTQYTGRLIELGFRELSMNSGSLLKVKNQIRQLALDSDQR